MPSLFLNFYSGAQEFLRLVIEDIHALSEQDLTSASEWIVDTIRDQTCDVQTLGFIVDGNLFDGIFERYIALDSRNINQIIRDAQVFHNREVRFSVDEGHARFPAGCTTLHYVKGEHPLYREPVNETDLDRFLKKIEAQQQTLLENSGGSFLSDEADAVISFSDFLKKLETRQMNIMSKLPFNSSSSSVSSTRATIGTPENSPIEIGREALSDEVFQPQLPNPDAEACDTADEAFCDAAETFEPTAEYCENLGVDIYIQSMMNDVIQKLETAQEKCKYMQLEEALVDHDVRTAVDYFSVNERDSYMSSVENFSTNQKARLSMTVATSTDVEGKKERVPVETQTDKESSDSGEDIAAIRDCIRTILKNRSKMSTNSKKRITKEEEISRVTKKTHRSSRSPKCCSCGDKKKEEQKEEKKKEMIPQKKEERAKKEKRTKLAFKMIDKAASPLTGEYSLGEPYPEEWYRRKCQMTGEQCLGEPYPEEWYRKKTPKKSAFNLKEDLDRVLPECSDVEEPFNRKLREKWAHDGMKSLKMPLPITNLRLPERHRTISRFDRFQRYSAEDMADEVMDMYNLVRIDSVNYKIVPRSVGSMNSLHKAPKGESTAPNGTCLAVVDESDPWLNWEDHYFKVFRVMNVSNKTCKKPLIEVLRSQNAYISRDMSKIPSEIPVDFNFDIELVFALEDTEKEGLVVMQLRNENGDILSTPFVFMIPKIVKPFSVVEKKEEDPEKKIVLKIKKVKKEKKEKKDKKIMYYADRMEKFVLDIVEKERRDAEEKAHLEYLKVLDEMNGKMDAELEKSTFAVPQPVVEAPPEPAQEEQEVDEDDDEDDFEKVVEECEEPEKPEDSTGSDFELVSCEDDELYD